jgi:hypothetical protein
MAALVRSRRPEQIQLDIHLCDPPPKHHPTPTRHGEQAAVPGGLRGVGGQMAVGAVIVDELFKVGEHRFTGLRGEFADPSDPTRDKCSSS